jgi:5-methylcytosine-specific restriction endonuclease McrA
MAANTAKHTAKNPDIVKAKNKLRAERAATSGGTYTDAELSTVRELLGNRCRFCDAPLDNGGHVEHLTPVSRGGSSYLRNITLSCARCNLAKTNKTLAEFIEWRKERSLPIRVFAPSYERPDKPIGKAGRRA